MVMRWWRRRLASNVVADCPSLPAAQIEQTVPFDGLILMFDDNARSMMGVV